MKIRLNIIFFFIIPFFVLLLFYFGLSNNNRYDTRNLIGKEINFLPINSLVGKDKIILSQLKKNQFTLINFWASWCNPCRVEHKYLLLLKKNKDLKILGINFKDKKKNALQFLSELGDPYYFIGKDIEGKVSVQLGVYGIPESILINNDLKVVEKFIGPLNQTNYKKIIQLIEEQ